VLIDGQVVWESDKVGAGGVWQRHYVDLTAALRGKRSATLALRLIDKTSLSLWTGIIIDDVAGKGIRITNGGFESRDGWALSKNGNVILPAINHYADFDPGRQLEAAARAFRGETYTQSPDRGHPVVSDAMYGVGRLRLAVEPFTRTPIGACTSASQVLTVDAASPRYEIDFFQTSPHTPYAGFHGAHVLTARIDGKPVWTRDANSVYPFWENGNGLQGPVDVSDFVAGKKTVTLSFVLCGVANSDNRPNPPIDIGFDNLRTVGLQGRNFGFETTGGWTFASTAPGLSASIVRPSGRPEAPPVSLAAEQSVVRTGGSVSLPATVSNSGATPLSGELAVELPAGWGEPPAVPFGPIAGGGSATVPLTVAVPAGTAEGSYWVTLTATTPQGTARVAQRVVVIGDTIRFTPGPS
jgi:hypothetical protein